MRELILDTAPEDFDPARHFALGSWCFVGREYVWRGWENLPFPTAFDDTGAMIAAGRQLGEWANWKVLDLKPQLNRRHGTEFGTAFWRVLLLPWLLDLGHIAIVRQHLLDKLIEGGGERFRVVLPRHEAPWRFVNLFDFLERGVLDPAFTAWLCGRLLREAKPRGWRLAKADNGPAACDPDGLWPLSGRGDRLSALRIEDVAGIGRLHRPLLAAVLALRPARRDVPQISAASLPDRPPADMAEGLRRLLDGLVEDTMPRIYDDLFSRALATVPRRRMRRGKLRIAGPALTLSNGKLFGYALAAEAGELLVGTQHGGTNGLQLVHSKQPEIEHRQYAFVTWGRTKQSELDANYVPLPSPYLSRFRARRRKHKGKPAERVVLVGTQMRPLQFRVNSWCFDHRAQFYREEKTRFIGALAPAPSSVFWYRPAHAETGALREVPYLRESVPGLRILEGDLSQALADGAVAVLDHPGTTLAMVAAADTPFLCFWQRALFPMPREAEPCFEAFRAANILFDGAEQAAHHLNKVWEHLDAWWMQPAVRHAIDAFQRAFAWTDRRWPALWARALWQI